LNGHDVGIIDSMELPKMFKSDVASDGVVLIEISPINSEAFCFRANHRHYDTMHFFSYKENKLKMY
jgi:hypothetical protein